jgi:hypothetical protein
MRGSDIEENGAYGKNADILGRGKGEKHFSNTQCFENGYHLPVLFCFLLFLKKRRP